MGEESRGDAKICVPLERWIGVSLEGRGGLSHVRGHDSAVEAGVHVSPRPERPEGCPAQAAGRPLGESYVVKRNHLDDASRAVGPPASETWIS